MYLRSAILLATLATTAIASAAGAQTARRFAVARTVATTSIGQSAMIASTQDLSCVISASTTSALSTSMATNASMTRASRTVASRTMQKAVQGAASRSQAVPGPARATFLVAGDAGQSISVMVPTEVGLTRAGGGETARLMTETDIVDGPQFLGGNFDNSGSLSFDVGGQVTLASTNVAAGTYSGILAVIAQYN